MRVTADSKSFAKLETLICPFLTKYGAKFGASLMMAGQSNESRGRFLGAVFPWRYERRCPCLQHAVKAKEKRKKSVKTHYFHAEKTL